MKAPSQGDGAFTGALHWGVGNPVYRPRSPEPLSMGWGSLWRDFSDFQRAPTSDAGRPRHQAWERAHPGVGAVPTDARSSRALSGR
jgi:hypothetical protein